MTVLIEHTVPVRTWSQGWPDLALPPARPLHALAPEYTVPHRHVLCQRGAVEDNLFQLVHGDATVSAGEGGGHLVLGNLGPGDLFGYVGFLGVDPRRWATVRAEGPCTVRILPRGGASRLVREQPLLQRDLERAAIHSLLARYGSLVRELWAAGCELGSPAWPGSEQLALGTWIPALYRLGRRLEQIRLRDGQALTCSVPEGAIVLDGALRCFLRGPGGRRVELPPALAGEVAGFEAVLGEERSACEHVAVGSVTLGRLPVGVAWWGVSDPGPAAGALRSAMLQALAQRLDWLRAELVGCGRGLTELDLDQRALLAASMQGCAGGV